MATAQGTGGGLRKDSTSNLSKTLIHTEPKFRNGLKVSH